MFCYLVDIALQQSLETPIQRVTFSGKRVFINTQKMFHFLSLSGVRGQTAPYINIMPLGIPLAARRARVVEASYTVMKCTL